MIYSVRANLLMRIWAGLLLLMVAMLIGAIAANATGQDDHAVIAIIVMTIVFIGSITLLIGACRLLIISFRAILWG
jgi:ABC-type dipeptide/oligopeptide/nickel transport system permease subunit